MLSSTGTLACILVYPEALQALDYVGNHALDPCRRADRVSPLVAILAVEHHCCYSSFFSCAILALFLCSSTHFDGSILWIISAVVFISVCNY